MTVEEKLQELRVRYKNEPENRWKLKLQGKVLLVGLNARPHIPHLNTKNPTLLQAAQKALLT